MESNTEKGKNVEKCNKKAWHSKKSMIDCVCPHGNGMVVKQFLKDNELFYCKILKFNRGCLVYGISFRDITEVIHIRG